MEVYNSYCERSDIMIKKLFAAFLAAAFFTGMFSGYTAMASEVSANKVNFINNQTDKVSILNSTYNLSSSIAGNFQPEFSKYIDKIIKGIFNIIPKQVADGTLSLSPQELEKRKNILKQKIFFENDIRLFTLYAFMNYTGYSDESSSDGFHQVRKMVREDLSKMNLSLSDKNYYSNKKIQPSYYRNSLRDMGAAPNFDIIGYKGNIPKELSDLPNRLKEFYIKADIEGLYKKYKPYYDSEISKVQDDSLTALVLINNFLKVDINDIPNLCIEINLLESYGKNTGFGIVDKYKDKEVMVLGPSNEPAIQSIVHEYMHVILSPVTENLAVDINKLSYKMKSIPQNSQARLYYDNWSSIVEESIARAIDYRVSGNSRKSSIDKAMKDGFILTEYFDKKFDEYKDYDGSLNSFIKMVLNGYYAENYNASR
jgi:hypothetical protein